jgi:hypothetical protein
VPPYRRTRINLINRRGLASQHFPEASSVPKRPPPPSIDATSPTPDDLLRWRKLRAGIWAGGFAIIVICGTLIGAQWKSHVQQQEALEIRKLAQQPANPSSSNDEKTKAAAAATAAQKNEPEVTEADLNRSIQSLSNLRGQLMVRKQQEEQRMDILIREIREKEEKSVREGRQGREEVVGFGGSGK